jgi:hypothetical protein
MVPKRCDPYFTEWNLLRDGKIHCREIGRKGVIAGEFISDFFFFFRNC